MADRTTVARWESRSGKYWVELYRDQYGYGFTSPSAAGSLPDMSEDDALAFIEARCQVGAGYFQPDAARTAMQRAEVTR